jgi:LysR family cys regulon transcriptional activator
MTLDQLRFLCEIVDQGFSISRAADALRIAQPWVSKHVGALEEELGVEVLRRLRGRIVGLSEPGEAVLDFARRMIADASAIKRVGHDFTGRGARLIIATTHLNARYTLPPAIKRFRRAYPKVRLGLLQATTDQTIQLVLSGKADMAVGPEHAQVPADIIQLPGRALERCVIVPVRHPLSRERLVRLEQIALYPLISFESSHIGAMVLNRTFERHNLQPNVVISATDTEVVKAYVKLGLGIAVVPSIAIEKTRDRGLRAVDAGHLFEATRIAILLRADPYVGDHICDFAEMIEPAWTRERIRAALSQSAAGRTRALRM